MILSQEEKDLAVEVEAVKRQGNQKLAHEHLVNKRALSQKETEFKDKLFQEVAALVEAYKKTPEYVQVIKKQIIDAKSFAKMMTLLFIWIQLMHLKSMTLKRKQSAP